MNLIEKFAQVMTQIKEINGVSVNTNGSTNFECYKSAIAKFENTCGKMNENGLKHFRYFYDFCSNGQVEIINSTIEKVCL